MSAPTPTASACYELAKSCQDLFKIYVARLLASSTSADAGEQQARFNIWAANMGVFADERASLDHRLKEDNEVRTMVIQLLDLINRNLERVTEVQNPRDAKQDEVASIYPRPKALLRFWQSRRQKPAPPKPGQGEINEQVILIVKETIDRLQRLSSAIRHLSAQNRYLKAVNFIDKDDDGEDISSGFRKFAISMVKHQYKNACGTLCEQLGVSIFLRRNAFLYMRRHQKKLARERTESIVSRVQTPALDQGTASRSQYQLDFRQSRIFSSLSKTRANSSKSAALSGTTVPALPRGGLSPNVIQRLASPPQLSVASSRLSVFMKGNEPDYPPAPIFKPGMNERSCPYCFDNLQKDIAINDRRWKRHVDKDLEPYVCVFPECRGSLEFFSNFEEWLAHSTKSHAFEWYCDAAAHDPEVFSDKQAFQTHMKTAHAGTFTDSQLPVITELGARPGSRPFTICPLCNCLPEDIEEEQKKIGSNALELLPKHIARHLKSLSFLSLPWREDVEDNEGENLSNQLASFSHDASLGKKEKEEGDADSVIDAYMVAISLSFEERPTEQADTETTSLSFDGRPTAQADAASAMDTELEWKFIKENFYDKTTNAFIKRKPYNQMEDPKLQNFIPRVKDKWRLSPLILWGHSGRLTSVAFSPDGKLVVSGAADYTVRLWNAVTGEALQTLKSHSDWVRSVAFSPDGKQIASGADDKTIRLWDAVTGEALQILKGHSSWVMSVAFSPDGKQITSGADDNTVRLWNAVTAEALQILKGHSNPVESVAFSPDGKQIASGADDCTVRLWNAVTGEALQILNGHSSWVMSVAFSPDGKQIASGADDNTVRLWNAVTGEALQILKGHSRRVRSVAFSPDGKQIASGAEDCTVRLWDAVTGEALQTLESHSDWVKSVAFSPDGKQIASGADDNTIRLWNCGTL